jgi:DNA polymerase-3 subunit gamma/tau
MTQALYRKWRPKTWDEVVGQEHIVQTLKNAIANDRVGHAYLFSGPRGTGKTTTARLLAKAVNCLGEDIHNKPCDACDNCRAVNDGNFLDLIEIDAASNTSVEDVRDLRDKINFSPNSGKYKVYIIDEVHMLSTAAFNALLKTLEEPPDHAIFILATTEIHKIPATVLSRCQRHEFRKLSVPVIAELLEKKALEENFDVDKPVYTLIARQATGSLRDGISLLDQLASTNQKITLALAENVLGTAASQTVINLVESLAEGNLSKGMEQVQKSLDTGADARQFARQIVDYLRNLLLIKIGDAALVDTTREIMEVMASQAQKLSASFLLKAISQFSTAASDTRSSAWQPGLALELALARCLTEETVQAQPVQTAAAAVQPSTQVRPVADSKPTAQHAAVKEKPVIESAPVVAQATARVVETPPPVVEEAPAIPGGSMDIAGLQQNWKKVIEAVRKLNPGTSGLANSARLLGVKNGCLILGFASDLLKTKMESNDHLEITRRAIQQVTGINMPIRCEVTGAKAPVESTGGVAANSLVHSVINELGGQIIDSGGGKKK